MTSFHVNLTLETVCHAEERYQIKTSSVIDIAVKILNSSASYAINSSSLTL